MAEPTIEALRERPLQLDGCVRYAGILPGVDLVCRTQPEGFKDEIVYHTLAQVQPVTFRLYAPELSLTLQGNGDLHALDAQGVCRFILPMPFVLDSENELGEAHTTLSRDGEGWLLRCEPDADFFNCTAFGKQAEFIERYLRKGVKILTSGRIQNDNYTNKDGQMVYSVRVMVDEIEFKLGLQIGPTGNPLIGHELSALVL